ncbi:MAG: CusA/CzcA family heavy metal efflux RND transporter [Prolixibacteraceae bacterium]|nr:CusA/CzcA family heavy metal efflux RND transporter [Prolixibacteraceae bacterium]
MLEYIIGFSIRNKLMVMLFTATIIGFGLFALTQIPIGAVPDITNNQVQVITTSRNLSTQDVEQFITWPVELEMANLPGVKEIRSISKFGLSVVTIVFEERLGTYLPRQLIAEKIKSAAEKIPEGFGVPEMGPISTGLGEIYQYILDTKPGFDSLYSPMDLRTIQDWHVKRLLSGIPGVVEVNTWGGYLKQYEVTINPDRLRSSGLTIGEVFEALEKNNHVAGGGYIEKNDQSYFIRGEGLVASVEDIENTVVTNRDGIPLLIKDIARVGLGYATRFGAITGNGEGEKVLGQVMMLKNANSKLVINNVKKRVAEIQETLPEGVYINPFLERSALIAKTTKTVAENLILGFLIVAFVVILLIGDYRSGLVVASVIPICLLFGISMMYIFGIDANLMSLGAIDFGIIIDGAVIIVEFIAFQIAANSAAIIGLHKEERQDKIDKITYDSAIKMLRSAVFGQLIIMIVFIPVLSLTGVEGKMFRPMALAFCFALLGAMILCFTYVPVMSALFLRPGPEKKSKRNISERIMSLLHKSYHPVLVFSMHNKKLILSTTAVVFITSLLIFGRMGGEFVPTLDEGDFVIQPVLPTGTSLGTTIGITTKIEKILLEFPEVEQVVSRIGAAEVPTDPMSMEESDIIVTLKPIKTWTSAKSKDELAEKFKEALAVLPGFEIEFTQPIEMRFNELITGVRADVAIKIYGEDLTMLANKAVELKGLISHVEGASDITVEKVEGLPQMTVTYDRDKLARYGIPVEEANQVISMGFAGLAAGTIFEGQKRFDLAIRLERDSRQGLDDLRELMVPAPGGVQIPLSEIAEINYTTGPAKISRDMTKRHIVVGINVRNRDMESVVTDIQTIVKEKFDLPPGYSISYGGQYQNLRSARQRLMIAIPVALVLIFILLHFAFKSFRDALMIFSAIPLSAVGGILLLWIRGMPFSISAGVGFIALFGIAVLNGIVLIEHLKELKNHGILDVSERIYTGTRQRLRPVVMTAAAAALGFLPMAISTSAGAEVQRPLATVVIGGLITSTLLTMIILPLFYSLFDRPERRIKLKMKKKKSPDVIILLLLFLIPLPSLAQEKRLSREDALKTALENNPSVRAALLKARQAAALVPSGFNPDKTTVFYNYDENNIAENGLPIKVWGVSQNLRFPTVYAAQRNLLRTSARTEQVRVDLTIREMEKQVHQKYDEVIFLNQKLVRLKEIDSLYARYARQAEMRYAAGESNYLDRLLAESKYRQINRQLLETGNSFSNSVNELLTLMNVSEEYSFQGTTLSPAIVRNSNGGETAGSLLYDRYGEQASAALRLEKHNLLPDIELEYFQGTNNAPGSQLYRGFRAGLSFPLWYGEQKSKIRAARLENEVNLLEKQNFTTSTQTKIKQLKTDLVLLSIALGRFENGDRQLAEELKKNAVIGLHNGEIDFYQFLLSLENSFELENLYLDNLLKHNQIVYELNYLLP